MAKGKAKKNNERLTKEIDINSIVGSKRKRKPSQVAVEARAYEDTVKRKPIKKPGKTAKSSGNKKKTSSKAIESKEGRKSPRQRVVAKAVTKKKKGKATGK
eukprot:TRINITY_DN2318_c0_g1_i2.p2 TRINITY_DN2318_c0_g1~~TRINITY_DN2318_c0_g1_i2.p2  ORF type:complete len:101 (-),score=28.39 TRINITY_DN2318_c0_g1_i2:114-416(-)